MMETSDFKEAAMPVKVVWRSVTVRPGALSVTTSGIMWMLEWRVLSLATVLLVSILTQLYSETSHIKVLERSLIKMKCSSSMHCVGLLLGVLN